MSKFIVVEGDKLWSVTLFENHYELSFQCKTEKEAVALGNALNKHSVGLSLGIEFIPNARNLY